MGGVQRDQQVDMVGNTADALGDASESADGAAQVFVEIVAQVIGDQGGAMFRGEDQVIAEACVSGGHGIAPNMRED